MKEQKLVILAAAAKDVSCTSVLTLNGDDGKTVDLEELMKKGWMITKIDPMGGGHVSTSLSAVATDDCFRKQKRESLEATSFASTILLEREVPEEEVSEEKTQ